MKKINIIRKSDDFKEILNNGKRIKNNYFIIYYNLKKEKYYRFGLSVGKKISNKAVIRNKLKRRIKNIIDNNKNYYQKDKDYIIILTRNTIDVDYFNLENSFKELISKIKEK